MRLSRKQGLRPTELLAVKRVDQLIVERMSVEVTCFDAFFQSLNSPRQMRREFSVAQDAERGFDVASGVRWSCSAWHYEPRAQARSSRYQVPHRALAM